MELRNSKNKVLTLTVNISVQGATIPTAWRKALEAFPKGTTLREFYISIEGELGVFGGGQEKRLSRRNLEKRRHAIFLSTLKRLRKEGILSVHPSSFLDEAGGVIWVDSQQSRSTLESNTRIDWAKEMSKVRIEPNLRKMRREAGSQASWTEERAITLRKKGPGGRDVFVEGFTTKPMLLP